MAKRGDPYRKKNRVIRTLTNAATRNSRPGFKPRSRNAIEGKRGIRRLMKRDPADGLQSKAADTMTSTKVGGGPGTDKVPSPRILSKANKTPAPGGSGVRRIRDRGQNKSLKKR